LKNITGMKKLFSIIQILIFIILKISAQHNPTTIYFAGGNICPAEEWKLVFHDEFIGDEVDTVKWYTYFPYGPNNSDQCEFCRTHNGTISQQIFLDKNLVVDNGTLKIVVKKEHATWFTAVRDYTSGNINSKQDFTTYSKYEIRCKIPYGMGFWPAFWVFGWSTEIDVFEFGSQEPNKARTTLWKYLPNEERIMTHGVYYGEDYSQGFHTFAVEYDPFFVSFLIDGDVKYRFSKYFNWPNPVTGCNIPPGVYTVEPAYPRWGDRVQVIAGVGVGVEDGPFTDPPNEDTVLPNNMEVDYIRVYQREPQPNLSDLCDYQIKGNLSICGYEPYSYTLNINEEGVDNMIWTTSDNLNVQINNNHEIQITANTDDEESAWIKAEIKDIEGYCPKNTIIVDLQINPAELIFDIEEMIPACFPLSPPGAGYATNPLIDVNWEINSGTVFPTSGTMTYVEPNNAGWFTLNATTTLVCRDPVTVSRDFYVGNCIERVGMITVSPNPADELINIDIEHSFSTNGIFNILIINQLSEIILQNATDQNSLQVDVSSFSPGIYYIIVQRDGKSSSASFIVVH
jgi:beta-glucanase (GH16 family)